MQITCKQAMTMLFQYLDDDLDNMSEADIRQHVHDCRECFSRVDFENALRDKVRQSAESKVPTDVQQRLKTLISNF
jgi:anti-sigma factor (TIGR02949 family)